MYNALESIYREHWQAGCCSMFDSQEADKSRWTAAVAFRKPLGDLHRYATEVWHWEAKPGDLCPPRTQESWNGLTQAGRHLQCASSSQCSSFFFFIKASPHRRHLSALWSVHSLGHWPVSDQSHMVFLRCPVIHALWTDYKCHLNNHFPIPSARDPRQTQCASPTKLLWLKSLFWVQYLWQTSVKWQKINGLFK